MAELKFYAVGPLRVADPQGAKPTVTTIESEVETYGQEAGEVFASFSTRMTSSCGM